MRTRSCIPKRKSLSAIIKYLEHGVDMYNLSRARGAIIIGLMALAISTGARADGTDPADLVFWDTIKNSTNPEEYKAYLQEFPTGRFAAIARLRAKNPLTADGFPIGWQGD